MGRIEILGSVERRRRWRPEEKVSILDEAFGDGGTVAAASERHGVSRALIYYWRRQAREGAIPGVGVVTPDAPVFVPVRIEAPAARGGLPPLAPNNTAPPEPTPPEEPDPAPDAGAGLQKGRHPRLAGAGLSGA